MSRGFSIPGRAQLVPGDPPAIYDAAHNPDGARALAAALPELAGEREVGRWRRRSEVRPVVCCIAILAEKDARSIIEAIPDPLDAWARVCELAGRRGGVALAAGSHYLLSCIWTERPAQSS